MALENEGAQEVPKVEYIPSCSSTSTTDRDTPQELPIFVRGRGKNWNLRRIRRSKSVPNSSHMGNRTATSTTARSSPRGLRMFKRSLSVQWKSSLYTKMPSTTSTRDTHGVPKIPALSNINRENQTNGRVFKQTIETPPPHYSSLDSSLDIIPGGGPSHMNYGFQANESASIINNDPPPSYMELFSSRMRHTVRQMSIHSTTSDYSQECTPKRMAKFCAIGLFFVGFAIVLPVAMVIQGITHLDDCPIEPRIPIFLIIGGLLQLVECFGRLICKHCTPDQPSPENGDKMSWDPLLYILFILLVLSSIYIYQTNPSFELEEGVTKMAKNRGQATSEPITPSDSSSSDLYCHETTFKLAYWIVTSYYTVLLIIIMGTLQYLLFSSCMTYRAQRWMGQQERDVEQA